MKASRLKTALLGSGAAIAMIAATVPASADEISDLRQQIDEMQNRVAQIEADRAQQRRVSSAAAVEAGDRPRTWKLPGTNTSMGIGGYAKLDLLWDIDGNSHNNPVLGPEDSIFVWATPAEGSRALGTSNGGSVRMHARQSRFWIRTWTPTDWGELATHIEGDFFGGASLSPSNSNGFRLRQAYGRLGPVLAGQTWSTFMPLWSNAELLDFSGPTGNIFVRAAMIRFSHDFGSGWQMQAALEDPLSGVLGPLSVYNFVPGGVVARRRFPDVVFTITKSHTLFGRGRLGAGVVIRDLNYEANAIGPGSDSEIAWGGYVAFAQVFNNKFRMGGQGSIGQGIGKYLLLASGTPEAVVSLDGAGNVNVDAVFHIGGMIWARYNWLDNLRSTVAFGYNHFDPTDSRNKAGIPIGVTGFTPGAAVQTWTMHTNLIWSPVPQVNIGAEYILYHANYLNSPNGTAHRVQISFQYNF